MTYPIIFILYSICAVSIFAQPIGYIHEPDRQIVVATVVEEVLGHVVQDGGCFIRSLPVIGVILSAAVLGSSLYLVATRTWDVRCPDPKHEPWVCPKGDSFGPS